MLRVRVLLQALALANMGDMCLSALSPESESCNGELRGNQSPTFSSQRGLPVPIASTRAREMGSSQTLAHWRPP